MAGGVRQSSVSCQKSAVQRFGECHVGGVVGTEIVSKAERSQAKTGGAVPPPDGKSLEVGQSVERSRHTDMATKCQSSKCRNYFEVQQCRGVQIVVRNADP